MTLESSSSKMTTDKKPDSSTSLNLSDFLWQSPLIYNCHFDESAKQAILSRCYETLWMNNESIMHQYFFTSRQDLQESLIHQSHCHDGKEQGIVTDPTLWHTNAILPNQDLSSQKGRQCGHVFRKGEPVYRCRNCGLDDTCVFCSKCFHATNHDGHDILFSVSPGSGGCCDCGDPEAWKVPLQCKIHTSDKSNTYNDEPGSERSPLNPELVTAIRSTIASVLNFLLDTFALAPDEVALNSSTEDLVRENQEQRNILSRLGIPSQLPNEEGDTNMENIIDSTAVEEDVDMDKENSSNRISPVNTSKEDDGELYACIAWNDEAHAFSHVLESIMTATGWDWEKAKQIVDVIHVHGREIIAVSKDIAELRKIAAPLSAINLGVTIRPAKETFREQVCGLLVDWLNELVNGRKRFFENIHNGDAVIRNILSEELCAEWELRLPLALLTTGLRTNNNANDDGDDEDEDDMKDDMAMATSDIAEDVEMFEPDADADININSKPESPESFASSPIIYRNQCDIASIDWDPAAMVREYQQLRNAEVAFGESLTTSGSYKSASSEGKKPAVLNKETAYSAMGMQKEFEEKLRLDYFMLYDLKLWKEVRISLRELYISTLASSPHFKKILGKRLARNYARLAESFLLRDREPENSIILFSVQLLTVPTVSDLLVHNYYFFGLICSTLTAFFLTDRLYLLLPSDRAKYPSRINCESRAFRTRRYFNAFHDLRYIMNVDMIKQVLAQDPLYLRQYLDLISLFQGMNAQVCQKDTHVEYESEIWVNAFNVTLQIAKCCRQFSDCFSTLPNTTKQDKIDTATTVVRAVSRVLKKIMDWGKLDPEEEAADRAKRAAAPAGTAPPQKIYGATAQVFHTVTLRYTEPFEVIKYNVATQPVSFHHPLHWLLSGLLEYAHLLNDDVLNEAGWEGGFKKMITMFSETNTASPVILLPILDYPVRTIVFSSQIRAGVWVRNGYGIRNQAHHYRDISLRENTYDADVFLLQLGFVTIQPNRFLATLLDRFDLVSWFLGKNTHDYYDASQTVFMVEEILNLLIVIACERANVSGMSILDKIRREIVHNLCLGSSAYSELTKRIPERITEHPEFDRILGEVAKFKAPDGVNDHGLYELLDPYFSTVDTYFWHFSRNNREEAETILKARWKKENPARKEEEFFILPKHNQIAPGPFQYLGDFLQSTVFAQLLFYAMWNVRMGDNHKSDTILDQTLYLLLLALTDENNSIVNQDGSGGFMQHVCDKRFMVELASAPGEEDAPKQTQELTLFDLMVLLQSEEQYDEVTSRFIWIFGQLESKGPTKTRELVQDWKVKNAVQMREDAIKHENNGGIVELSEVEKKKLAAKERQKKIMAQFVQAQSQFMENNEDLYDDDDDDFADASETFGADSEDGSNPENLHQFCSYPTGTCIVCQEDVNDRSLPYGLLGLIQTSNIMRETPMDDNSLFNEIYAMGSNLDVDWQDRQCLVDDSDSISGFPAQLHKTGLYASSCGHLMHIKCFEVYCTSIDSRHSAQLTRNHPENRSRREFMCPLCKSLGNILLPVFWKGKKESFPGVIAKAHDSDFSDFYKTDVNQIVGKLKHTIIAASRAAQSKKRSSTATASRMKDVVAQLLPSLPIGGTTFNTGAAMTTATPAVRDWAPITLPTRHHVPTTLENMNNDGIDALPTLQDTTPNITERLNNVEEDPENDEHDRLLQNAINSGSEPPPDGKMGPFENETLHSSAALSAPFIKKSYTRLLDVLGIIYQEICTDENEREMSTAAKNVDMLWGIMGYTIAGVEIAARGASKTVAKEHIITNTLFDQIPPQTQMLLRILSDTVMAYTTMMCPSESKSTVPSITMARVSMFSLGRIRQMFEISIDDVASLSAGGTEKLVLYDNAPILEDDPFMILTELSLHMVPLTQADIFPFVRTLLLAEFAKTAVGLLQDRLTRDSTSQHQTAASEPSQDIAAAKSFAYSLMNKLGFTNEQAHDSFEKFGSDASFCALLKFFVLPFLRRTLILMIVRFGLIIPPITEAENTESELDCLLRVLHLPSFSDFLQPTHMTESLLHHWCSQHVRESERRIQLQEGRVTTFNTQQLISISLDLPTPIYLVALPKRLDRLFDESMRRVCQKCGTVPSDPALCLFCGTFVCAQSFCCAEDEEGECNLHTLECGGEIGIFLSVKRCVLILLHNGNGWFINAPYLDPHGEVDQGLRHGRPQYLNVKRYAEIRKLWLQHNIPIYVARQIEANYDIGGWTTL
ncbi:uncharacterized protein EV154DRAFT_119270 [Mucor mucedo]|uniref:uncharacterized protein n=1 Tax=Mucor mucedo TaxID=29922 RepID=UPI00221EA40D|nr:uncharacterized protein EV154DRAFT_119270 [Mucor mucedo]KAI7893972.1 hypothetical protein EV154DRAFT_119270 [Mucor mucedo]